MPRASKTTQSVVQYTQRPFCNTDFWLSWGLSRVLQSTINRFRAKVGFGQTYVPTRVIPNWIHLLTKRRNMAESNIVLVRCTPTYTRSYTSIEL